MSKIKVLVDIDDTIIDTLGSWCQWLNRHFGTSVEPNEITCWDIKRFFPKLTAEQVYSPLYSPLFWLGIRPKEHAEKYLKKLSKEVDLYLCTDSNIDTISEKVMAIAEEFPSIDWHNKIIVTPNKQLIDADILIDDAVHNLIGGKYKKILMTAPHNRRFDAEAYDMTRVNDWRMAYNAVRNYIDNLPQGGIDERN